MLSLKSVWKASLMWCTGTIQACCLLSVGLCKYTIICFWGMSESFSVLTWMMWYVAESWVKIVLCTHSGNEETDQDCRARRNGKWMLNSFRQVFARPCDVVTSRLELINPLYTATAVRVSGVLQWPCSHFCRHLTESQRTHHLPTQ